ncbi:MAG: flippase-like domain-containing protein [Acidobacteriales bacterium]|nr:flippase-like domain-containing protein [Terriglobales bacterium]
MKKRTLVYGIIVAVLAALVYVQFRSWRNFDWSAFWSQTRQVDKLQILGGLILIYLAYVMRAIRWKIFLRPVRQTSSIGLVTPTVIGFTGLALLGRPGELIRPYLIARQQKLTFSSQLAVWAVERIFDIGAFALLLISAIFLTPATRTLPFYDRFRTGGFAIVGLVAGLIAVAMFIHWKGDASANWIERRFSHLASNFGHHLAVRIREFRGGLNTIHSFAALVQLVMISVTMWIAIALTYWEVMRSYGAGPLDRPLSHVPLLMASSMVGSLIQLPGVGGGSQLATISTLQHVFGAPPELAASCGILLWLVTFVSIVPAGLILAHRQRVSLRDLSHQSQINDDAEMQTPRTG